MKERFDEDRVRRELREAARRNRLIRATMYIGNGEQEVDASAETGEPNTMYVRVDPQSNEYETAYVDPTLNSRLFYYGTAVRVEKYGGESVWRIIGTDVPTFNQQFGAGIDTAIGYGGNLTAHTHTSATDGNQLNAGDVFNSGAVSVQYGGTGIDNTTASNGALMAYETGGQTIQSADLTADALVVGNGTDAPTSLSATLTNQVVKSNDGSTWSADELAFTELADTPSAYTSQANKYVAVKPTEDGLDFVTPPATVEDFIDLGDVPSTYAGSGGYLVRVKPVEDGLEFIDGGSVAASIVIDDTVESVTATTLLLPPGTEEDAGGGAARYDPHGLGTAPEYNATGISGCQLWLKANAGITQSGGLVSQWDDQSGNSRHATQATGANKPAYGYQRRLNGYPTVIFNGTASQMTGTGSAIGISGAGSRTVAIVGQATSHATSGTTSTMFMFGAASTSQAYGLACRVNSTPVLGMHYWVNFGYSQSGLADFGPFIYVTTYNGTVDSYYLNGYPVGSTTIALSTGSSAYQLGSRTGGSFEFAAVSIAELIVYDTALSQANREAMITALGIKYNIPVYF